MENRTAKGPAAVELIPYNSLFPEGDVRKAVERLQEEISEHRKQLDRLHLFASENTDLINLVRKLPDELSHDIMVPFGKAAFFPGRLIHTNEFLVLLGEGYYADQTSKQTVGVLKRRDQVLDSKVKVLNSQISDLQARIEYCNATAIESGEGAMIINEYEEPERLDDSGSSVPSPLVSSEDRSTKMTITDEEYAQVLAGLDELEKAELAVESECNEDKDKNVVTEQKHSKLQDSDDDHDNKVSVDQQLKNAKLEAKDVNLSHTTTAQTSGSCSLKDHSEQSTLQFRERNYQTQVDAKGTADVKPDYTERSLLSVHKANVQEESLPKTKNPLGHPVNDTYAADSSRHKAFTGSIIEHNTGFTPSLSKQSSSHQAAASNPSKPVSRFKMQKGR